MGAENLNHSESAHNMIKYVKNLSKYMPNKPLKIFFSGIGGSGVSAIAGFMSDRGHTVVGSDRSFDRSPGNSLCTILKSKGITIVPQDGKAIDRSFDFVVFSTAVEHEIPEYRKAASLKIPVKTRPEYLAELSSEFKTIAVAGTSGKSTAAGMLAFLMNRLSIVSQDISNVLA